MTAATPTPEELAVKLTDVNEIAMFYDPSDAVGLALDAATMIRTQVRQIEAQRAETEHHDEAVRVLVANGAAFAKAADEAEARATTAEAALAAVTAERDGMREALEDIDRWARAACLRSGAYAANSDAMTDDQADFYNIAERSGAALSAKEATDER